MPQSNELQAYFPEGSRVVPNPNGTAPGIDLDVLRADGGRCRFFALPGVPAEMREMWNGYFLPPCKAWAAAGSLCDGTSSASGPAKANSNRSCPTLSAAARIPRVGINASRATIILRIVAEGDHEDDCRDQIDSTVAEIHQHLGTLVFGEGDDELQDAVLRLTATA